MRRRAAGRSFAALSSRPLVHSERANGLQPARLKASDRNKSSSVKPTCNEREKEIQQVGGLSLRVAVTLARRFAVPSIRGFDAD
jgi:hypothetical protein